MKTSGMTSRYSKLRSNRESNRMRGLHLPSIRSDEAMPIAKIIRWNLALIFVVGLYGLATDEPYWRDNGHGPWLYDYLFWLGLVLNEPSAFAADYLSRFSSGRHGSPVCHSICPV